MREHRNHTVWLETRKDGAAVRIPVQVPAGTTVLQAMIAAGLRADAPCGGKGTCGKCRVQLDGQEVLACQTVVDRDLTVQVPQARDLKILTGGEAAAVQPDGTDAYVLAVDVGTTTVAACLLDGLSGRVLAEASCANPQSKFGADVISRIEYALGAGTDALQACIGQALEQLAAEAAEQAGILPEAITAAAIVGNTAMHHLLLGIDPRPLVTPPYMPAVRDAMELDRNCRVRILPNIAGFVGGDTVGCMTACGFDHLEELTLLIDIGTNGEMVLADQTRRIACSTAAGPAFEGAKISCGMRGAAGAVDRVWLEDGAVRYHVLGETAPVGLCGSGLLDLVAALLDLGVLDDTGYLEGGAYELCDHVVLTQKDVREVQLAKAAIRAGIELMAEKMGAEVAQIRKVCLAGAFGNYMNPASACRIGMIPPVLESRIVPVGNAACEGAKRCALSAAEFARSRKLAADTEFLELAGMPQFQDSYVDALAFEEDG